MTPTTKHHFIVVLPIRKESVTHVRRTKKGAEAPLTVECCDLAKLCFHQSVVRSCTGFRQTSLGYESSDHVLPSLAWHLLENLHGIFHLRSLLRSLGRFCSLHCFDIRLRSRQLERPTIRITTFNDLLRSRLRFTSSPIY